MTAMQKLAWWEISVSLAAIIIVSILAPWMGYAATGAFGLLGLLGFGIYFVRSRGKEVIVDERDKEIERQSTFFGVHSAWMFLFMALIFLVVSSPYREQKTVSIETLSWLVWIQFALCYFVKGIVTILIYRRQDRAPSV